MNNVKCPVCGQQLMKEVNVYKCDNKHCFDISKYNHTNLLLKPMKSAYDKDVFLARKKCFEFGLYDEILNKVAAILKENVDQMADIIDIGSGEGYYAKALSDYHVSAIDIVKDAIILGAKSKVSHVDWFVGDLANLPFMDASFDALLNIFSPSNYKEFKRIGKKDALLIKVIPGNKHFIELRDVYQMQDYDNHKIVDLFAKEVDLVATYEIKKTHLIESIKDDVIKMSPVSFSKNQSVDLKTITINAEILVGKLKK